MILQKKNLDVASYKNYSYICSVKLNNTCYELDKKRKIRKSEKV